MTELVSISKMKLTKDLIREYLESMGVNILSVEKIRSSKYYFYISIYKEHYLLNEKRRIDKFPKILEVLDRYYEAEEVSSLVDGCICFKVKKESRHETLDLDIKRDIIKRIVDMGFILSIPSIYDDGEKLIVGGNLVINSNAYNHRDGLQEKLKEFKSYIQSLGFGYYNPWYRPYASQFVITYKPLISNDKKDND